MNTNLEQSDLNGDEFANMLINYQKTFPDVTSFDMIASGTTGSGLIKTINKNSNFFCKTQNCYYTLKIRINQIKEIIFLPTVFDNGSEIDVKSKLTMNEELEIGETLYYKLKFDNPSVNSILFTISPRES